MSICPKYSPKANSKSVARSLSGDLQGGWFWVRSERVPRPLCPRHIPRAVPCTFFKPAGVPLNELEEVVLAPDEFEAMRLVDGDDLYGMEAAVRMKVSRQTFDRILKRARGKIASALVHGRALRIDGTKPVFVTKKAVGAKGALAKKAAGKGRAGGGKSRIN